MTKVKTVLYDIYGRSIEIAEGNVKKAYAKTLNDRPDFDLAVAILFRDDYETRCIPTADGDFAYMPDRLPREGLYRYAHRVKSNRYAFKITEEVFLAAFPELSYEEKTRVHAIFRPGEGSPARISKILVRVSSSGLFDPRGKQMEVIPVIQADRDRICKFLDSEGVIAPQGTRFSDDTIPSAFAHTKWVLGDWTHKSTNIHVPAPKSNEQWMVDLVFHTDRGCFVAIPVSMNIPDQRHIRIVKNHDFSGEPATREVAVPISLPETRVIDEVTFLRCKIEYLRSFVVPLVQDAYAFLDPDVAIQLLAKELFGLKDVLKDNPDDVTTQAKLAGIDEYLIIRSSTSSANDVKIAVMKNEKDEWHIIDETGPTSGPFTREEALKVFNK